MTVITVVAREGRLDLEQRRTPAETLTDAVLVPEVGQFAPAARGGFQVHLDGDWRQEVRAEVIERVLAAMARACGLEEPPPTWWVNFRVTQEGSWGSRGGVLSILSLLDSGVFTEEKVKAVRATVGDGGVRGQGVSFGSGRP
ncbi:tautomerase enzyme [Streptomyces sp. NPDC001435]|uniref:tautomerase enzyme n=1 Tax=unclassified Streptomyces TaxID=2593676 RepID=UPI00368886B0